MKSFFFRILLSVSCLSGVLLAEEADAPEPANPTFVVVVPEKIGEETLLLGVGSTQNLIVQGEIEKQLIRKGLDVRDVSGLEPQIEGGVSWQTLTVKSGALVIARQVKADLLVYGQATAVRAGKGNAYGVTSVRAQADILVRMVRVEDGKVLEVFDSTSLAGDQAFGIAAKQALREAGKKVAKDVAGFAEGVQTAD